MMASFALMIVAVACMAISLFLALGAGRSKEDGAPAIAFGLSILMAVCALILAYLAGAA
jgi:hypothetical protein